MQKYFLLKLRRGRRALSHFIRRDTEHYTFLQLFNFLTYLLIFVVFMNILNEIKIESTRV